MRFFLFILFFSVLTGSQAQVLDEIKKKAEENQQERETSSPKTTPSTTYNSPVPSGGYSPGPSSTVYYDDPYADNSGSGGTGLFLLFELANVFFNGQAKALSKADSIEWIRGLEGGIDVGVFQNNYLIVRPQVRANWGIFSSSLRYYMSYEEVLGGMDSFNTLDWQIIHFNFINDKNIRLSIGTGFTNEFYTNTKYHESTLGGTVFIKKWKADFTYRTAADYSTSRNVRREIAGGIHRKLKENKNWSFYGSLSGMKATYYEEVDLWTVGLGVNAYLF